MMIVNHKESWTFPMNSDLIKYIESIVTKSSNLHLGYSTLTITIWCDDTLKINDGIYKTIKDLLEKEV